MRGAPSAQARGVHDEPQTRDRSASRSWRANIRSSSFDRRLPPTSGELPGSDHQRDDRDDVDRYDAEDHADERQLGYEQQSGYEGEFQPHVSEEKPRALSGLGLHIETTFDMDGQPTVSCDGFPQPTRT